MEQKPITATEALLRSTLQQSIWALTYVCRNADHANIVVSALAEAHINAATLALYEQLGDNMDVKLLDILHAVRDRIRETSDAIRTGSVTGYEAMPGLRLPEAGAVERYLLPDPFPTHPRTAPAPDR